MAVHSSLAIVVIRCDITSKITGLQGHFSRLGSLFHRDEEYVAIRYMFRQTKANRVKRPLDSKVHMCMLTSISFAPSSKLRVAVHCANLTKTLGPSSAERAKAKSTPSSALRIAVQQFAIQWSIRFTLRCLKQTRSRL